MARKRRYRLTHKEQVNAVNRRSAAKTRTAAMPRYVKHLLLAQIKGNAGRHTDIPQRLVELKRRAIIINRLWKHQRKRT